VHILWRTEGWNNPAAHSEQAFAAETAVKFPTAHLMQALAPGSLPVLVIEHAATFEPAEYSPAAHTVHVVAPAAAPMSVIEPAWQSAQ
jgi:hypothetical protein